MPKVKISEYSATANSNTDVASINIDEGCAPSGINNAIRAVMGHLKDFQQGTNGDPFNGPVNGTVGATTPSTGAFTTLSATGVTTVQAGTASLPAITTTGDTNTGIWFPAADTIAFTEGGVESMRINASGNLGLGVTPSAWGTGFQSVIETKNVGALSAAGPYISILANAYYNSSNKYIYTTSNPATHYAQVVGQHQWFNAASGTTGNEIFFTQAMTLDASGRFLVGGTTSSGSEFRAEFFSGSATSPVCINIGRTGVDTLIATAGATNNFVTGTAQGDSVIRAGANLWLGSNGANNILFYTSGANERARIDSSGNLLVGSPSTTAKFVVKASANSYAQGACVERTGASNYWSLLCTTADDLYFGYNNADKGYISNSTGVYVAVSDERLKKNITDIQYGLDAVLSLRSVEYHMTEQDDSEKKNLGFIAQEALEVVPESVSEMMGGMYGMDKSAIIPVLVKAIQEQQALITQLTARITALESA